MEVIFPDTLTQNKMTRWHHQLAAHHLKENSVWLAVGESGLELVAVIEYDTDNEPHLQFALRDSTTKELRALIPIDAERRTIMLAEVVRTDCSCLDPELFTNLVIAATEAGKEFIYDPTRLNRH